MGFLKLSTLGMTYYAIKRRDLIELAIPLHGYRDIQGAFTRKDVSQEEVFGPVRRTLDDVSRSFDDATTLRGDEAQILRQRDPNADESAAFTHRITLRASPKEERMAGFVGIELLSSVSTSFAQGEIYKATEILAEQSANRELFNSAATFAFGFVPVVGQAYFLTDVTHSFMAQVEGAGAFSGIGTAAQEQGFFRYLGMSYQAARAACQVKAAAMPALMMFGGGATKGMQLLTITRGAGAVARTARAVGTVGEKTVEVFDMGAGLGIGLSGVADLYDWDRLSRENRGQSRFWGLGDLEMKEGMKAGNMLGAYFMAFSGPFTRGAKGMIGRSMEAQAEEDA